MSEQLLKISVCVHACISMQQPGRCWCIGFENNTTVVLTKQPDGRAPSRQLRERDNYFPSLELRMVFLPRSPRISSPARALETSGRLLKKAELYVTVQPWIFALCNTEDFQSELAALGSCRLVPENCAARAATSILTFSSARCECGMKWGTEAGPIDI